MVRDVSFNSDQTISLILAGKGGKTRRIGIPVSCSKILEKYIGYREIENHPERHIFSSQTHKQTTVSCIEEIFKKYINLAKERYPKLFTAKSYPPHAMRHTTASHMLEAGVPLIVIKNFLGHTSLSTTQVYAEISQNAADKHLREWAQQEHRLIPGRLLYP